MADPTFKGGMPMLQVEHYKDAKASALKAGLGEDEASKVVDGLGATFEKNRKRIGVAMTGAGAAILGLSGVALKSSQEQAIGIAQLDQSLQAVGRSYDMERQAIERVLAAQQAKTNFGDEEQRAVLARLIPVLGDHEKALAALPVVLDAAAFSGRSATTVSETLSKFLVTYLNVKELPKVPDKCSTDCLTISAGR